MQVTEHERVRGHIYRARSLNTEASLTIEQWEQTIKDFDGLCAYCLECPFDVLEHFVPVAFAGTTVTNCVPACCRCNCIKGDRTGDGLISAFGKDTINRISQYLASRSTEGTLLITYPQIRPRIYKRKKPFYPKPLIQKQSVYDILDLYQCLTCPDLELARRCGMEMKTIYRVVYGDPVIERTANTVLSVLSDIYEMTLSVNNVTGINVRVNRRLEAKEARESKEASKESKPSTEEVA